MPSNVRNLMAACEDLQPSMIHDLQRLVLAESPSDRAEAADQASALVAESAAALGGAVVRHAGAPFGDALEIQFCLDPSRKPLLLLGHIDTVWPMGTLETMPFRVAEGRVWGPGVLDMKAGVIMALTAVKY